MNAIELLKQDHKIVEGLFKDVEDTPPSRHPAIFKRIKGELESHAHVEEVIFYPALKKRGKKDLIDSVLEGVEEHGQMKKFLGELASLTVESEAYEPKLKVLIEDTRHHVKEEERTRTGMFAMAKDQLEASVLEKLGVEMEIEKTTYQAKHGIKPESREALKGTVAAMFDKAVEVVSGIFSEEPAPANASTTPKAKPATTGRKPARRKAETKPTATTKPKTAKSVKRSAAAAK